MNARILAVVLALAAVPALAADKPLEPNVGYRAMSLPFPSHQLHYLGTGDRIDVMATFEASFEDKKQKATVKEPVTATILQNVRVLGVDRKEGLALVELNPNEAQYLALFAAKDKTLWLSRRGAGDKEMHPMEMASARKLFR